MTPVRHPLTQIHLTAFSPIQGNKHYAHQLIALERIQARDERAYYDKYMPDRSLSPWRAPAPDPSSLDAEMLDGAIGHNAYAAPASASLSPMERFLAISPREDPHRTLARARMAEGGIAYADFASEDRRVLLLKRRADALDEDGEEGSFVASSQALPAAAAPVRPRVAKRLKTRRRVPGREM